MKTRLLVVDDDLDHQTLLQLNLLGAEPELDITVAGSREEFLDLVRNNEFDCIILDFNLGRHKGVDVLTEAGADLTGVPVIVVSSCQEQNVAIASFRKGVSDFVPKEQAMTGTMLWKRIEQAVAAGQAVKDDKRQAKRREESLLRLSETDALTGLMNRRGMERWVEQSRMRHDRRLEMSCVLVDIDNFKHINDTYGHAAGDRVLREVSALLRQCARDCDLPARWGGEEFVLLGTSSNLFQAWSWAERFRRTIEKLTIELDGQPVRVTISAGVAMVPTAEIHADTMTLADHAMYLAKATGRNRVCTWEMVKYRRLAEAIGMDRAASPDARRTQFIESARASLGPCQLEHLTSHCESVSALACRTVRWLAGGGAAEQARAAEQVRLAGLLHDIGKCAVPEEIVAKPGELSADERWLMSAHAEEGAAIAEALGMDEAVVAGVRDHHRWHARPRNVDEISDRHGWAAGVLAVADAVVAMTTERPYRAAMSMSDAITEIRRFDGCQFEHAAVEAVAGISVGVCEGSGEGIDRGRRAA